MGFEIESKINLDALFSIGNLFSATIFPSISIKVVLIFDLEFPLIMDTLPSKVAFVFETFGVEYFKLVK